MKMVVDCLCGLSAATRALCGLLLVLCILLSIPTVANAATLPEMKRVGVVSILGSVLYEDHVGVLAFGNKLNKHDVTEWGLDEDWEEKMAAALAGIMEAEIVPLSIDRTTLTITYPTPEDEKSIVRQYRMPKFKRITETLQQIAADNQLDAIFLLASDAIDLAGTNQSLESFGIFSSGGRSPTYYYIIARIHLIDGATGKRKTSKWLETAKHEKGQFGRNASETAPEELSKKPFAEYSDEEQAALAERFKTLPDSAWTPTLTKLLKLKKSRR